MYNETIGKIIRYNKYFFQIIKISKNYEPVSNLTWVSSNER